MTGSERSFLAGVRHLVEGWRVFSLSSCCLESLRFSGKNCVALAQVATGRTLGMTENLKVGSLLSIGISHGILGKADMQNWVASGAVLRTGVCPVSFSCEG